MPATTTPPTSQGSAPGQLVWWRPASRRSRPGPGSATSKRPVVAWVRPSWSASSRQRAGRTLRGRPLVKPTRARHQCPVRPVALGALPAPRPSLGRCAPPASAGAIAVRPASVARAPPSTESSPPRVTRLDPRGRMRPLHPRHLICRSRPTRPVRPGAPRPRTSCRERPAPDRSSASGQSYRRICRIRCARQSAARSRRWRLSRRPRYP